MRITIDNVKAALGNISNSYDIINAIRNSAGDNFQRYVPIANADNIAAVGAGILINQTIQNDFITALVDRISLVVLKSVSLENPLKRFKKGMMPLGRTIEEIFTDITKGHKYNAEQAESEVFKREIPNVKTLFHEVNREDFYKQTIQDASLQKAFVSWSTFDSFLSSIINAIYNSAEVEEFSYMMLLIDNYAAKGLFKVVPVDVPNTETAARAFVKTLRKYAGLVTLPMGSREYNALAVMNRVDMENLHLIITAELQAEIDVEVLAKAFNMDKTNFIGKITVVDKFATPGLQAVMVDEDWFMVYDTLQKMETIRNPQGLYWNYIYHVWQVLSASRFSTAIAFMSDNVPPVTQVIIDPTILSIKQGASFTFTPYIRATDNANHTLTWAIVAAPGTTIVSGTSVSNAGVLTVAATQEGQFSVTATTSYTKPDPEEDITVNVVGESVVKVYK